MGNIKLFLVLCCYVYSIIGYQKFVNAVGNHCTSNSGCFLDNQVCSKVTRMCECKEGTRWFAGKCHGISHYGDKCQDQFECTQSGDAHLHCSHGRCQCGSQRNYDKHSKKCVQITGEISQSKYHVNKMIPRKSQGNI